VSATPQSPATPEVSEPSETPQPPALSATDAALAAIADLAAARGPLVFFQSGGCCDGSLPMCLCRDELPAGPNDLLLGELAGAPFYVDADQYRRWGSPSFLLDLRPGPAEGFSLSPPDAHFVTRSPAPAAGSPAPARPVEGRG